VGSTDALDTAPGPVPETRIDAPAGSFLPIGEDLWLCADPVDPPGVDSASARGRAGATLPLRAAMVALGGFLAVVVGQRVLLAGLAPRLANDSALVVGCVVAQYAAMVVLCVAVCRRWAGGSLRGDLGLGLERGDVTDGMVGWLVGVGLVAAVSTVLQRLAVPMSTNNPVLRSSGTAAVELPQWLVLILAGAIMAIVAPVLEEVLFRGIVLRGLRSRLPAATAVVVQAVAFGAFHADPRRGLGNIGLVMVLATVGLVLGMLTERRGGRLGASMVAHGLHNGMAFLIGVSALR